MSGRLIVWLQQRDGQEWTKRRCMKSYMLLLQNGSRPEEIGNMKMQRSNELQVCRSCFPAPLCEGSRVGEDDNLPCARAIPLCVVTAWSQTDSKIISRLAATLACGVHAASSCLFALRRVVRGLCVALHER